MNKTDRIKRNKLVLETESLNRVEKVSMIVDPKVHVVKVARRSPEPQRVSAWATKFWRTDVRGTMETTAWSQVMAGRSTVAEYNRICDKLAIFQRARK